MPVHNCYKKTRIAPTPSGFLHLGNALSFSITAALAHKNGTKIFLRIDDLDQARVNKQYIADIFDTLNFLEIPIDEGPRDAGEFGNLYSQLHRMDRYRQALKQLADEGLVFACTCSRKQLSNAEPCSCMKKQIPLSAENVSWRLITPDGYHILVKNYNGETTQAVLPVEMNNFIVKKKDGFPSYQLTSVVDDIDYGTDLVVRGEDLWPSTLGQHLLASALGKYNFNDIAFYHHPLLTELSGNKLSKSAGAASMKYLRESGKSPADIYALIAGMMRINRAVVNWQQLAEIVCPDILG